MDQVATDEVTSVAGGMLDIFLDRGIEYIFGNAGTDFPPLIEAIARARQLGRPVPQPVVVPHENVAMAMAHGHHMVTGRVQAVMVHVGLGTANAINGIYNAARLNIPILLCAGRTPATESGGVFGGRNNYINWAQEMFDQAGMLRELVKWEYELRHPSQIESVVDRAIAVAESSPPGPVYVTLPREVFAAKRAGAPRPPAMQPTSKPQPAPEAVAQLAKLLAGAKRPVIVTSAAGHVDGAWPALARIAERFAIPVVQYRPRYMALPTDHPMHFGYNSTPLVRQADLVIVLESDVPWIPDEVGPIAATVVQVGLDPLFQRYPMRSFQADLAILSDPTALLQNLSDALPDEAVDGTLVENRRADLARQRLAHAPRSLFVRGETPKTMTPRWVTACLDAAKDESTILINEYPLVLEELTIDRPGTFFAHSPAGGLGWAMGAALGAKLGRPDATVIACIGDGTYMFGNPTPTHMVSQAVGLPVLFVVFNNRRWGAVHRATLSMCPDGYAAQEPEPPFATLEPSPDYEKIVTASGGYGERVDDPAELPAALQRALRVVREEGRQAVLNVICEAVYARTS